MPTDDLTSIPGLEGRHVRALARHEVTDFRSLAESDQRDIYRATANVRPRPSLELVARWQEEARGRLPDRSTDAMDDVPEADATDWQTVASFAVIFTQRWVGNTLERRVEAERTEVEPEQEPRTWAGWDFESVGSWMAGQLHPADSESTPARTRETRQPEDERTQLTIETASIITADQTFDLMPGGALVGDLPVELTAPVRVIFTVSGARSGTAVQAVTRVLRPDAPGWNPEGPVALRGSGQAEFDLSGVPAGQYEMSLIAWAPDATARPVSVKLPALTIG